MKDYSSKSWKEFLIELSCISYLSVRVYQRFAFRCLPGKSVDFSNHILLILCICLLSLNCYVLRFRKNNLSLIASVILPLGSYTAISSYNTTWILGVLGTVLLCILSYLYARYLFKNDYLCTDASRLRKIRRRKRYKICCFSLYIPAVIFLFQIGCVVIQNRFSSNKNVSESLASNESAVISEELTGRLSAENWKLLSRNERLRVLEEVILIEKEHLDIEDDIYLQSEDFGDIAIMGNYCDQTQTITINTYYLDQDDSNMSLNPILHEIYHSYQYQLVENYVNMVSFIKDHKLYNKAKIYKKEFADYCDGSDDYMKYFSQVCEIDSREYAYKRTDFYGR